MDSVYRTLLFDDYTELNMRGSVHFHSLKPVMVKCVLKQECGQRLHAAANQTVPLWLQELIQQSGGDLPEFLLQTGHVTAAQITHVDIYTDRAETSIVSRRVEPSSPFPRSGTELGVIFNLWFRAAGSQRGHNSVLQSEGDHLTAARHRKDLTSKHEH